MRQVKRQAHEDSEVTIEIVTGGGVYLEQRAIWIKNAAEILVGSEAAVRGVPIGRLVDGF